jgi:hypothetical protein
VETEYPKVLASKEASGMVSTWTEYLRLSKEDEGTAILEICMYEALAELEADDEGKVVVPEDIYGVKVVGVEGGIIIGGELICDNDEKRFTFTQATLGDAISWLKAQRWQMSEQMVEELTKSVGRDRQQQATQQASTQPAREQPSKTQERRPLSRAEAEKLGIPIGRDLIISPMPRKR